ncbi:MAG TPA: LamG domain-containing protein, partial [Candidatus Limnocylindrales bacterium]|nr:LamG domain-containing protein [Candidatus Limnocylindrales bacterium]
MSRPSLRLWSPLAGRGETSPSNGWGIGITTGGMAAGIYEAADVTTTLTSAKLVTDGEWHHVVLVRSGGTTTVYVDKVAYSVSNATTVPGSPATPSASAARAPRGYFGGDLDEVAVYATVLTSADATSHYDAGRIATTDANLVTKSAYDHLGRASDTWDPTGTRTRSGFDRLGRTTATWLNHVDGSASGATGSDDVKSTFAYDAAGGMTAYCPARNVQSADACDPTST